MDDRAGSDLGATAERGAAATVDDVADTGQAVVEDAADPVGTRSESIPAPCRICLPTSIGVANRVVNAADDAPAVQEVRDTTGSVKRNLPGR